MLRIKFFLVIIFFLISGISVFSQTDDWKQYSSSMAGLKINYPSDWTFTETFVGRAWQLNFLSPGVRDYDIWEHSSINVCIQPVGNFPNSSNSRSGCRQKDDHLSDMYKDRVILQETIKLNGLQISKKITEDNYRPTATYIYVLFTAENKEFLISSYFPKRFDLNRYIPVFQQMLETLRVLSKRETLTYKNGKYDFALSYPTTWKSCPVSKQIKGEEEILLLVPERNLCNGDNYISVSRIPIYSGELMTGYQLQDLLKKDEYTIINSFLNGNAAQGEKIIANYHQSQSYFFTNYLSTYDLLRIFSKIEIKQEAYQEEVKEILSTTQRALRTTQ